MAIFIATTEANTVQVASIQPRAFSNGTVFTIDSLASEAQLRASGDPVTDMQGRVKLYISAKIKETGVKFDLVKSFVDCPRDIDHNDKENTGNVCVLARQIVADLRAAGVNTNDGWIKGANKKKGLSTLCGKKIRCTFVGTYKRWSSFLNNGAGGEYLCDQWNFSFVD